MVDGAGKGGGRVGAAKGWLEGWRLLYSWAMQSTTIDLVLNLRQIQQRLCRLLLILVSLIDGVQQYCGEVGTGAVSPSSIHLQK